MIIKSVDGTSYTLRDWINNEEFSLMAEAQMIMLKIVGKVCNWNEERMKNINVADKDGNTGKDKIELTRIMVEGDTAKIYAGFKSRAAKTLIITPEIKDYSKLPHDITLAAETQVEKLYIEAQPVPPENEKKTKK